MAIYLGLLKTKSIILFTVLFCSFSLLPHYISSLYAQNNVLTDSDALTYFSDPSKHIYKSVNFTGKILKMIPADVGTSGLQMYQAGDTNRNVIVTYTTPLQLFQNDCVRVLGVSQPVTEYKNMFGATLTAAFIIAESVEKIDCSESIEPAIRTVEINETQEQKDVRITIHKIEFSDKNTRAFLTVENKGLTKDITFYDFNSRALQNKSQYITTTSYDVDYPKIESLIPAGIEERGVVLFEPLNPYQDKAVFRFEVSDGSDILRFNFEVNLLLSYYDEILTADPKNVDALLNKGVTLHNLNNFSKAIETYDKALALDPNNSTLIFYKGLSLDLSNNTKDALETYDKALALDPNNNEILLSKGIVLLYNGNYTAAIEISDKILASNPNNLDALINKGISFDFLNNTKDALETYDKALALDPNNSEIVRYKGDALANSGNYTAAIETYDKALALDPNNQNALDMRGYALDNMINH